MTKERYTAILEKEGEQYVALCPDFDIASQGNTVQQALANLKGAVALFLECADKKEIEQRQHTDLYVTQFEVMRTLLLPPNQNLSTQ